MTNSVLRYYSLILDEGTDCSNKDSKTICLRTVGPLLDIEEVFRGFYHVENTKVFALCFGLGVKVFPMQRSPAIQDKQPFVEKSKTESVIIANFIN